MLVSQLIHFVHIFILCTHVYINCKCTKASKWHTNTDESQLDKYCDPRFMNTIYTRVADLKRDFLSHSFFFCFLFSLVPLLFSLSLSLLYFHLRIYIYIHIPCTIQILLETIGSYAFALVSVVRPFLNETKKQLKNKRRGKKGEMRKDTVG